MDFDRYLATKHIDLNDQQRQAVLHGDGPLLLLAVPGSGKTTVVIARCAHLVLCRGAAPGSILTLTFNRAAQRDMDGRFRAVFGGDVPGGLRFSTIHSFCLTVLREFGALVGRPVPRLVEDGKARLLRGLYGQENDGEFLTDDGLETLSNAIGYVKNAMLTEAQIRERQFDTANFAAVYAAYERYKAEHGCMDFDDMLAKALAVFRVRPDVLERFRRRYRYINVDEAQDTSRLQHAILRELAAPADNLFLVGDEDQSIYGFRAADPRHLLEFQRIYPRGRVLLLERNYRSTEAVVEAAGRLIAHNTARRPKRMTTANGPGAPLEVTVLPDSSGLCAHLVERLRAEPHPGSMAVLYRENASAVPLMDALHRAGLPFYVQEHRIGFFEHRAVRDVLAFLALARDPADEAALRQIYYKLNAFVGREAFEWAAARAREQGGPVLDALLAAPDLKEATAARLKQARRDFAHLARMKPERGIEFIMGPMEYGAYLRRSAGAGYYHESLLHAVQSLRALAAGAADYGELLERIAAFPAVAEAARANYGGDAVTLSSVHSAKGLEFDRVIVVDLFDGRFPSAQAIQELDGGDPAPMEEERRLFYVALTRARRRVELITAAAIYGEPVARSRFLAEALPPPPPPQPLTRLARRVEAAFTKAPKPAQAAEPCALEPGTAVVHSSFGRGVVEAYDAEGDIAAVRFPKYGLKKLSAGYCVTSGVMKRVE